MSVWAPNKNQIDALALPNGTFISPELTRKRINIIQNNPEYRQALEKASKMAGYVCPGLSLSRGRVNSDHERSLFNQNKKAERLIKEKRNGSNIITGTDLD